MKTQFIGADIGCLWQKMGHLLWVNSEPQGRALFRSGVRRRAEAILMKADNQALTSGVEGVAVAPGSLSDRLLLAEGVEKVPRIKIIETMIQNPKRC